MPWKSMDHSNKGEINILQYLCLFTHPPCSAVLKSMSDLPNIISSKIVTNTWDTFWNDPSEFLKGLSPRPILVLSLALPKESAEETQLMKLLQACQLQEQDYNLLFLQDDTRIAWHQLKDRLQVKTVVLFGVSPEQLGVSVQFMPYQVSRFNDCSWIPAGPVNQFMDNKDIKNHLWTYGLKPVFVDKVYGQ
jgi:hypothetical protein